MGADAFKEEGLRTAGGFSKQESKSGTSPRFMWVWLTMRGGSFWIPLMVKVYADVAVCGARCDIRFLLHLPHTPRMRMRILRKPEIIMGRMRLMEMR